MRKKPLPALPVTDLSVEISGRNEVLLCGCRGLVFYSEDEVRINTAQGELSVLGKKLVMRWAGSGKLLICGIISSVLFL